MDFQNLPICLLEWKKCLTPEADTPIMSLAPAAAFPSPEVPFIRMPE